MREECICIRDSPRLTAPENHACSGRSPYHALCIVECTYIDGLQRTDRGQMQYAAE